MPAPPLSTSVSSSRMFQEENQAPGCQCSCRLLQPPAVVCFRKGSGTGMPAPLPSTSVTSSHMLQRGNPAGCQRTIPNSAAACRNRDIWLYLVISRKGVRLTHLNIINSFMDSTPYAVLGVSIMENRLQPKSQRANARSHLPLYQFYRIAAAAIPRGHK